jgi:hypothetical protein
VSALVRGLLSHNAMGLERGPKVLHRCLLFHPAYKVDEPGEASVEGNVLEHQWCDTANQKVSFDSTVLVSAACQLFVEGE